MKGGVEDKIRSLVHCCACGGSLKSSKHINGVGLNKLATWKYPIWGNILVKDKYPEPRATAILCDRCIQEKRSPRFAVEWNKDYTQVRYHPVTTLKDLPPITEEDMAGAEASLYGFGVKR